jgi:hypothetical protein
MELTSGELEALSGLMAAIQRVMVYYGSGTQASVDTITVTVDDQGVQLRVDSNGELVLVS